MKVDTQGYHGKVSKSATVHTNDSKDKVQYLTLQASIEPLISISPQVVYLEGRAGQVAEVNVMIRSDVDKPLHIEPLSFDLADKVVYAMEEIEAGKLYRIRFSNVAGLTGLIHGSLTLKTNYPEKPELNIRIRCKFKS